MPADHRPRKGSSARSRRVERVSFGDQIKPRFVRLAPGQRFAGVGLHMRWVIASSLMPVIRN
jgi:hypothetical protein